MKPPLAPPKGGEMGIRVAHKAGNPIYKVWLP